MRFAGISIFFLGLLVFIAACRPIPKAKNDIEKPKRFEYVTLSFEENGKPCIALISEKAVLQAENRKFTLSLFIEISTVDADENGHPKESERAIFHSLEKEIFEKLASGIGSYSFVGNTTMPHYRDIMLYIPVEQQARAAEILGQIKSGNSRLKSFTFEIDPNWESVKSFTEAVQSKN